MYLKSEAVGTFDRRLLLKWNWTSTTILLVAYDWDPIRGGAEALASRRLARVLLAAGARVHVLTASSVADDDLQHARYAVTVVPSAPLATGRIRRAIQMVQSGVPEASGPWVSPAVATGLRVLESLPDDTVIYSRSMPGTSNIVGWHLARRTGRAWVAHFSDSWPSPQVLPPNRKFLAPYKWPLFAFWRNRIQRDVGALTFTNPGQASEFAGRNASATLQKSFVVTHLASRRSPQPCSPQYEQFHIVHTGNLYSADQTSAALLQGLRLFLERTPAARNRVRFTQAGWANGDVTQWTERCGLGDVVELAGRLREDEVLALLERASLLIAIDYTRAYSTTLLSKLPDYINARRPILAIATPTSTLGRVCREDGAGLTAAHDAPEEVAERIASVFAAWQSRQIQELLPRPSAIAAFASRNVVTELAAAVLVARQAAPSLHHPPVTARSRVGTISGVRA